VDVLSLAEKLTPMFTRDLKPPSSKSDRCGIALVGAGRMGQLRASHIYANPRAELVCVIDPFIDGARKLAQQFHCESYKTLQEAFDADKQSKITAVWVSTPTFTHDECVRLSAKAGKAIFTEKPVAETPADISTLFDVCKQAGVELCCGFQRRFDTSYVAMKEAVAKDEVGKIVFINVMFGDHPVPPMEFLSKGGCPFMDLVPHDADFIGWLLNGEEPEEVYATGSSSTEELKAANVCDNAMMVAKYASGVTATICLSRGACYGYDNRIEVFGTKGRLVVETPAENTITKQNISGTHTARLQHSFPQRFYQAFGAEVDTFVRVCLGDEGTKWPVGEKECIAAQRVAMAAQIANKEHQAQKYSKCT
jgi:myo-inositol 2-dehydrogenase/D-chiro-inositol 1-dehydrogenase